jgi:hypothetical protein
MWGAKREEIARQILYAMKLPVADLLLTWTSNNHQIIIN